MKAGWEVKALGEHCEFIGGGTPSKDKPEFYSGQIPWATVRDMMHDHLNITDHSITEAGLSSSSSKLIPKGEVVIASRVGLGKVCILGQDTAINQDLRAVIPKDTNSVDKRFLFHWFKSMAGTIEKAGTGATVKGVKLPFLKSLQIPLPPLAEQKRIVSILDEAFEGLDRARENAEANLKSARELFEETVNSVFITESSQSPLVPLEELAVKITKGSSPKWQGVSYVDKPGVLFVTSENVGVNKMLFNKKKYVEDSFNEKDKKSVLSFGDVLTNIVGASIGRTAIYDRYDIANINQAVCLIRCNKDILDNLYLSYLLNSPYFKRKLHEGEVNTARANLSLTFFRKLQIPVPSLAHQTSLTTEIGIVRAKAASLEATYQTKLQDISDLRQSLLQKAFAGELT